MAQVAIDHVCKSFDGKVRVVDDLSLDVPDGAFVVLVGPSGCGKSTTLRMIAGLESVTAGDIHIGDRLVNRLHPKDRNVAMVFQNYALYPHMTVQQNMSFGLKNRKVPKVDIARRVGEAAEALGISDLLGRKPKQLSGGQQQRVALGRAIVRDPAVFLFDEPLSNLDATLRLRMRAEIKALQRRLGTTTIHVTHDQEEAMTLGDHVVIMCDGRLQQQGAPIDVYSDPVNRFVAGFIGSPPMNVIDGRIRSGTFHESSEESGWQCPAVGYDDGPVVAGIRPHLIKLDDPGGNVCSFPVILEIVEMLGDTMDLVSRTSGGTAITARIPARTDIPLAGPRTAYVLQNDIQFFAPGRFGQRLRI